MPSRSKQVLFTVIAILAPFVLLGLVWELTLRWLEPAPLRNSGTVVRVSADTQKQYELIPGAAGIVANAPVSINSFGCRDREYPLERPPGVVRIVGIGDSLTFGQGVGEQDAYLSRLERALAARNLPVEVINCGVYGYNVNEEARRFAEVAAVLHPDIITIGYELGDILENPPVKRDVQTASAPEGARTLIQGRRLTDWLKTSHVITFLSYRYSFLLKKLSLRDWDALYADDSALWKNLSAKYAGMAELARAKNIDVAVIIVPELSNLDERYPFKSVHARVAAMCRARGMQVIDLLPALMGQDGPRLWIHPQDRHPNARGNEIMAGGLLDPMTAMVHARIPK